MHPHKFLLFLSMAILFYAAPTARAQYPTSGGATESGITVEGLGELQVAPDVVEINMRVAAKSELTDDAVVKHRDARKRTLETFQALKLDNLKITERELSLRPGNSQEQMQAAMQGMAVASGKRPQIEISSMLRARLTVPKKMSEEEVMSTIGKLLDAAQDSGAAVGPSEADMSMAWRYGRPNQGAIVKFVVTNAGEMREKASQIAVDDAKRKAQRLARLNGVALGSVVAVQEFNIQTGMPVYTEWGTVETGSEETADELIADSLTGAVIKVKLHVRFAIAGDKPAEPKKG